MEPGFYRFAATRTGWEDFTFPTDGPIELDGGQSIIVGLEPTGTTISGNVTGIDPTRPGDMRLRDVVVELTPPRSLR